MAANKELKAKGLMPLALGAKGWLAPRRYQSSILLSNQYGEGDVYKTAGWAKFTDETFVKTLRSGNR